MTEQVQDAWLTAEPEEPTFTLQGGDPLGSALALLWAQLARLAVLHRGDNRVDASLFNCVQIAKDMHKFLSEADKTDLLKRATSAEVKAWDMDAWRKGTLQSSGAEGVKASAKISSTENTDLHDALQRACAMLSQMRSQIREANELLADKGYNDGDGFIALGKLYDHATQVYNQLQPREDRKLA